MVTETTTFNPYDIVDYGVQIFLCILLLMFLGWCIFQIIKYCKIIKANAAEYKARRSELQQIKNSVNKKLSKFHSDR